jgi:FkbM family methyltransferase
MEQVFESWFKKNRRQVDVPLSPQVTVKCNLWDEVQFGFWWAGELYEYKQTRYFKSLLSPGAVVADVGANVGYYSLVAAPLVGSAGQVYAFEPMGAQFAQLCANVMRNSLRQVNLVNLALSDEVGEATITLEDENNTGSASLRGGTGSAGSEKVQVSTLDHYFGSQPLQRLDVVKIDVEGFETAVLRGGEGTIGRFRPVVMIEVVDAIQKRAGSSRAEVYEWFDEHGYEPFAIERNGELRPITEPEDGTLVVFKPGGRSS